MVDILKRSLAPITDQAWAEIDAEAVRTLKTYLSARRVVDISGPHGWELAAINQGCVELEKKPVGKVHWGKRSVLPLIEVRIPFHLDLMELDSVTRGSTTPDLEALQQAAQEVARFEETAVYLGFGAGDIQGIQQASAHKALKWSTEVADCVSAVVAGMEAIQGAGVGGPYALVLGPKPYQAVMRGLQGGYPVRKRLGDLLGGPLLWSPVLDGGVLLSTRGGDFELTLGQDLSIGYVCYDRDKVELYFTESFTFRVLEPTASVIYTVAK